MRKSWSRKRALVLAGVASACAVGASAGPASARTALPQVVGPLPVTAQSYPFGAADHQKVPEDLSKVGYVEEEYLVSGKANVYDWPEGGAAVVRTPNAPYATRVLVRRPKSRTKLSGNVVVEMLNPSNLFDLNIGWALSHDKFTRNGDVWVGITAKPITIAALKTFDPQRYRTLAMNNPLPLDDPRNCTALETTIEGDSSRTTENGLVWDIYSQVGAWLKSTAKTNPLAHRRGAGRVNDVEHAYGFGYSQTGGYLVDYINAINPLVVKADRKPIYDGYLVGVAGGDFVGSVPINQCTPAPSDEGRRQIRNAGVPVIRIMSQSDYLLGIASRRADSNRPKDRFRHYEMAGAAHATPDELYFSAASADIVRAGRSIPPASCNEGPRSRFPSSIHFNAAQQNLDQWVRDGRSPPHARPILVRNGKPVLDEFGNVRGGLRSPFVDVPTSTWFGSATGASFCFIAGYEKPFDPAQLKKLYPTHDAYVKAVERDVRDLVADRFLTRPDGAKLVRQARASKVPG